MFEKDQRNSFLITNPTAIFKFIRQDRFLNLAETEQLLIVQRLDEILDKCSYNALMLSEQIMTLNVSRSNQETIDFYRSKTASTEAGSRADKKTKSSKTISSSS